MNDKQHVSRLRVRFGGVGHEREYTIRAEEFSGTTRTCGEYNYWPHHIAAQLQKLLPDYLGIMDRGSRIEVMVPNDACYLKSTHETVLNAVKQVIEFDTLEFHSIKSAEEDRALHRDNAKRQFANEPYFDFKVMMEVEEFEGIPFKRIEREVQDGDTYLVVGNLETKLLTAEKVDHENGWVVPVEVGYPFNINRCHPIELLID